MSGDLREIIFDTETTGLKPEDGERVIEIGAIELVNRFPTGRTFHEYLNPEGREVHPDALRVHGITNESLLDKPTFTQILDKFLEFFSTGKLIAHNANFDMGFLNAELARAGKSAFGSDRVVDTLQLARRKHPMGPNSLDALCSRYGIDNSHREKHGALLDSELLAEVYIELLGGRQASFTLEQAQEQATSESTGSEISTSARKRPSPLPSRLSTDEISRHKAFVETLGENAIWNRYAD